MKSIFSNWKKIQGNNSSVMALTKNKHATRIAIVLLIVGIILFLTHTKSSPSAAKNQINTAETVQAVSKLMVLPTGEDPVTFEIADPKFLSNKEPFFIGAEQGDILLIYQRAGKAIIYSKKRNLIVNAGPLVNTK